MSFFRKQPCTTDAGKPPRILLLLREPCQGKRGIPLQKRERRAGRCSHREGLCGDSVSRARRVQNKLVGHFARKGGNGLKTRAVGRHYVIGPNGFDISDCLLNHLWSGPCQMASSYDCVNLLNALLSVITVITTLFASGILVDPWGRVRP